MPKPTEEVRALLESAQRFVITTHARPDGDAIGSSLAMAHYLKARGKEAVVINCDSTPFNMDWLPGADAIQRFDGSLSQLEAIARADVIAVMDLNAAGRLGSMSGAVTSSGATKLLVDHHTSPETWFDVTWAREAVSSTGELVYELIVDHDASVIGHDIASCLYAAVVTDTGSFRYSNVTPGLHRMIADLLERGGIDPSVLHARIYDGKSAGSLKLLSRVLDTLTINQDGEIAHMVISRRMLEETGASIEETDGYVNWGLALDGVRVSILFTETERGTKASFRSKGTDHVHKWAQALGGGGHPNASGAFLRKPLESAIDAVLARASRYLPAAAESPSRNGSGSEDLSAEDLQYLSMLESRPRKSGRLLDK